MISCPFITIFTIIVINNNPLLSSIRVAICNLPVLILKEKWLFSLSIHQPLRASRFRVGLRRPSRICARSLAGLILFRFWSASTAVARRCAHQLCLSCTQCFTAFLLTFWLLQPFHPLFCDAPWAWDGGRHYRRPIDKKLTVFILNTLARHEFLLSPVCRKLLWSRMKLAQISGYKQKHGDSSLTMCPFIETPPVGSLLGPLISLVMG